VGVSEAPLVGDLPFVEFVRANYTGLFRTAVLLTPNSASAEDLVQDTLAKLYPVWWRVEQADSPIAYVRASLTNTFLTSQRRKASTELVTDAPPDTVGGRDAGDIVTDRRFATQLLAQLNQRQRAAIVMRYLHDLDDEQIAAALGCRRSTARSLISRGLAAMRAESARMDSPASPLGGGARD
jgi:RNA polymerase sigma-70 factor (sigma-E family)